MGGFKCCVITCRRYNNEVKMHCFPKEPDIFQKWVEAVQRTDIQLISRKSYRVCDRHFSEDDKFESKNNRTNLKCLAVPTLELPRPNLNLFNSETDSLVNDDIQNTVQNSTTKKGMNFNLKSVNVTHCKALTPKARKLYHIASGLQATARRLRIKNIANKERIKLAKEYAESDEFLQIKVNLPSMNFINSQLRLQIKKSRGRRFTIDDKIFSLSLLKQSPKGYRLLQRTFALPSRKTLMTLLNRVPFTSGLNEHILKSIQNSVEKMKPLDRYCSLLFDEISLEPGLTYDRNEERVSGFKDCGEGNSMQLADHAMVFMARGLRRKWKQPIAYFFTIGGMSSADIVRNIKEVISALQRIGLKVVTTVCDQVGPNCEAINMLKQQTSRKYAFQGKENKLFGFDINGEEVVPLYDVPHLLKCVRNNLLNGHVQFHWKKDEMQVASWEHLIQAYELDVGNSDTKMMNKLTDAHVYKEQINPMKVKLAAQVFSQCVSSIMRFLVKFGGTALPKSAESTADFLLFMDKLFDSQNGFVKNPRNGKVLKCAVSSKSQHISFWDEAIKVLSSIKFLGTENEVPVPATITNWIATTCGFKYLWTKLNSLGFEFMFTRNFNQDPLENFFGGVRSHGVRNINPTCSSFVASFKSLVINNFLSSLDNSSLKKFLLSSNNVISSMDIDGEGIASLENLIEESTSTN